MSSLSLVQGRTRSGLKATILVNDDGSLVIAASQNDQAAMLEAIRDRLVSIATYTDNLETLLVSLNGYVDGLESHLMIANQTSDAIAASIDRLSSYTDGIEASQISVIARLETLANRLPSSLNNDRLKVDGSGATQPISAAALPLPDGAAKDASLSSLATRFSRILASDDLTQAYDYFDPGMADERIKTVTMRSVSLALTVTETYAYAGTVGNYRLLSITRN